MQRRAVVLVAILTAILGVAVVGSGVAQQPGPPTGTLELVQRNRESSFKFIDNPPRGGEEQEPSPGDMAIIVVGGISDGGRTDDVAITGGTGRYAGLRGTLRVTETRQGARFRFTFIG